MKAMAKIFFNRILDNIMTIDEVPERWKKETIKLLELEKLSSVSDYNNKSEITDSKEI